MEKHTYYQQQIIKILNSLNKEYKNISLGKHIATALDGSDLFNILDRDFLKALIDYKIELDMSVPSDDIDKILKEGMNLNNILEEEED